MAKTTEISQEVRVRAIVTNSNRTQFLTQVNNRVSLGDLTIMLPGGEVRPEDENMAAAVARVLRDELGVSPTSLDEHSFRYVGSKTYQLKNDSGIQDVKIIFLNVDIGDAVPINLKPESVLSVTWMTLDDVNRYIQSNDNWKIQVGALDVLNAFLGRTDDHKELGVQVGSDAIVDTTTAKTLPFTK